MGRRIFDPRISEDVLRQVQQPQPQQVQIRVDRLEGESDDAFVLRILQAMSDPGIPIAGEFKTLAQILLHVATIQASIAARITDLEEKFDAPVARRLKDIEEWIAARDERDRATRAAFEGKPLVDGPTPWFTTTPAPDRPAPTDPLVSDDFSDPFS